MKTKNSTKVLKIKLLKLNLPLLGFIGKNLVVKTGKNHPVFTRLVFTTPTLPISHVF
jgi:hypothetical protein